MSRPPFKNQKFHKHICKMWKVLLPSSQGTCDIVKIKIDNKYKSSVQSLPILCIEFVCMYIYYLWK